jgi:hypothetical protein
MKVGGREFREGDRVILSPGKAGIADSMLVKEINL